ncbi:MAG: phosphoribosylformylglycinamidine synthase [bacterium]
MIYHFYRKLNDNEEICFNVGTEAQLSNQEQEKLSWLLRETFEQDNFSDYTFFDRSKGQIVEIGPRLNFATPFSTNAVAICNSCGISGITRLERSKRYLIDKNTNIADFVSNNHDQMTECEYTDPIESFSVLIKPEDTYEINILKQGPKALKEINKDMGLGMDDWDIDFYYNFFSRDLNRNPTNVECFQLGQSNSEHSRHWFFKGRIFIDNQEMPETLFEIVKSTWKSNPENSIIAFKDNSSSIKGNETKLLMPAMPDGPCSFDICKSMRHITFSAETHNFPSGVAPVPGGETGTGGRIRDTHATGRGSLVGVSTAGFCTGNLNIPNYEIAGEDKGKFAYPSNLALPLKILIGESFGAYDYGNKFGEPCVQGFTRTFGLEVGDKERREWIKPIMFTGGLGQIDYRHVKKGTAEAGQLIVQIGGPAYRIGMGGGSASSMVQGENRQDLDFNAVQRGDAEMEQKADRVIRACVEMGDRNPILSIHDQGAGGPCNVITELIEPTGGKIDIRKITVGDKTMSVLELWGAEYQERDAMLVSRDRINDFKKLCERENVSCEELGEVDGNGRIVLYDSQNDEIVVDLELTKILGKMPQKDFNFKTEVKHNNPLKMSNDFCIEDAVKKIFSLPSVGSKEFLITKVDRSVTGLIARQQACGPLQLPVSNIAIMAQSHFSKSGAVISIGEQPIKMIVNPEAGARMAVGEAITNMVWAKINGLENIKASLNWMWAAKLPEEGSDFYKAATATRDLMIKVGMAVDGGKDSLSMAAKVGEKMVKAPGQMVVSAYASMQDIEKFVTPDIKMPGKSCLAFIDISEGKNRIGGSALAQSFSQIGDTSPDVDDPFILVNAFNAVQEMIDNNLILSGHDRSDGGLFTCLAEMAMSGNCGLDVSINSTKDAVTQLFSEELGLVIEYEDKSDITSAIEKILRKYNVKAHVLGRTLKERKVNISKGRKNIFKVKTDILRQWWESTSQRLEQEQSDSNITDQAVQNRLNLDNPRYYLSFQPKETSKRIMEQSNKPKVAIIREEGSNGDREMASAFYSAGFEPWDVNMDDLLKQRIQLNNFKGIAFVGGFSYADVLDSAKGWAGKIKFNDKLKQMFSDFYSRPDTFSLGICNGCQLMALLGWVPFEVESESIQPRFIQNKSQKFESRWVNVAIKESPSIMLAGMSGSILGVWVAHGEGQYYCVDSSITNRIVNDKLCPIQYTDQAGQPTELYPFNPNGSQFGFASLCSADGRHLAMMPHPERCFLKWQWPYMSMDWKNNLLASPWIKIFQNARKWVG